MIPPSDGGGTPRVFFTGGKAVSSGIQTYRSSIGELSFAGSAI
jgi:hypothetical protein